ncbi:hypothetical protein JCM10207_002379 [Rhodosporidiobolus poonsookiae]
MTPSAHPSSVPLDESLSSLRLSSRPLSPAAVHPAPTAPPPKQPLRLPTLTSLEALVAIALAPSPAPAPHRRSNPPSPSSSPGIDRFQPLPLDVEDDHAPVCLAENKGDEDSDPETELPYLAQSDSPVKRSSKLRKARPPGHTGSGSKCTSRQSIKDRLGYGTGSGSGRGGEKSGRRREGAVGRFACGVGGAGRRAASATMAEKGYGDGWGEEEKEEAQEVKVFKTGDTAAHRPSKRRTFWPASRPPLPKRGTTDSQLRREQNKAQHGLSSSDRSSGSSFVFVPRGVQRKAIEVWEGSESASEEEAKATPPSRPLSDAEASGENTPKLATTQPAPTTKAKHFRLPTLPSPPVSGAPPILLPTPAGLTDVSFELSSTGLSSLPPSPGTVVEHDSAEGGLFAGTPFEESPSTIFGEGAASFHEQDESEPLVAPLTADESGTTSAWLTDFLEHYDAPTDRDAASLRSSSTASSDTPLGAKYPRRLPLLGAIPAFPQAAPYPLPRFSPTLNALSSFNPYFPPASSFASPSASLPASAPAHVPFPSLAPSVRSAARPAPLVDLHASPPSPLWLTTHGPRAGSPGSPKLIEHVKGKAVPRRAPADPMKVRRDAERRAREGREGKGGGGEVGRAM